MRRYFVWIVLGLFFVNLHLQASVEEYALELPEIKTRLLELIDTANQNLENVCSDRISAYHLLSALQDAVALPQLSISELQDEDVLRIKSSLTSLLKRLSFFEIDNSNKIAAYVNNLALSQKKMLANKEARIRLIEGLPGIEELPANTYGPYSGLVIAPYLLDCISSIIKNFPQKNGLSITPEGTLLFPDTVGEGDWAVRIDDVANAITKRINQGVAAPLTLSMLAKAETDYRKNELEWVKDLSLPPLKSRATHKTFMPNLFRAASYLRWCVVWNEYGSSFLDENFDALASLRSRLALDAVIPDMRLFAFILLANRYSIELAQEAMNLDPEEIAASQKIGTDLIAKGRIEQVLMAGGMASRFKDTAGPLSDAGIMPELKDPIIAKQPRGLALQWTHGLNGPSFSLLRQKKLENPLGFSFVLSPDTWEDFMSFYWNEVKDWSKRPSMRVAIQLYGEARIENKQLGVITDESLPNYPNGHGNVRGWFFEMLEALNDGVVYGVPHSADNPLVNLENMKGVFGEMAKKGLVHLHIANLKRSGQQGGGAICQDGINNVEDFVPETLSTDGRMYNPSLDNIFFSTFINVINYAGVLFAVTTPEDGIMDWNEFIMASKGDEKTILALQNKIQAAAMETRSRWADRFMSLLPYYLVRKSLAGNHIVITEQVSGGFHAELMKAVAERIQNDDQITESEKNKPRTAVYLNISLDEMRSLGNSVPFLTEKPWFAEVKSAGDGDIFAPEIEQILFNEGFIHFLFN